MSGGMAYITRCPFKDYELPWGSDTNSRFQNERGIAPGFGD
jgi:hypothetical protein